MRRKREGKRERGGRPLKYEDKEALQKQIDQYFIDTPMDQWTITGLALALDTSRKVLCEYEEKDEYAAIIARAKLRIENGYEIDLKQYGRYGTQFALKNFGWKDKYEVDSKVEADVSINASVEIPEYIKELIDGLNKE